MKKKRGKRQLAMLLTLAMAGSLLPMGATPVQAQKLPDGVSESGSGWYEQKLWNTNVSDGTSMLSDPAYGTCAYWEKLYPGHTHTESFSAGQSLDGVYFINEDITVTSTTTGQSGLVVSGSAVLIFENNATLTVTGGDAGNGGDGKQTQTSLSNSSRASGGTGAGAGIELTSGKTLTVLGKGTISATGGNGGNGGAGAAFYQAYSNARQSGGGGGGGGAGAGIGSKGGNGGEGGKGPADYGSAGYGNQSAANGLTGSTSQTAGSLIKSDGVKIYVTSGTNGAAGGAGGSGGNRTSSGGKAYYSSAAGGGGSGGAAQAASGTNYVTAGGYGGGGGGVGAPNLNLEWNNAGGAGGGGGGAIGGYGGYGVSITYGTGTKAQTTATSNNASNGGNGAGASGGMGGSYLYDGRNITQYQTNIGGKGGNAGSYGSNGTTETVWPLEECVFEVLTTDADYNSANGGWMYDGSAITPSVKITHLPSGEAKTVDASTAGVSYANNIYGDTNGYGSITITGNASGVKLLDISKGVAYSSASVKLYFPIMTTVQFHENANAFINQLKAEGITDAAVTNMPKAKVLQRGVTETTDAVLATANVPVLEGYTFLGWYYYGDTYLTDGYQTNEAAWSSDGNPSGGVPVYDSLGKVNVTTNSCLNSNGTWNGIDDSKPVLHLYAMWKLADLTLTLDAQGGQGGSSESGIKMGTYKDVLAPTKPGSTFDGYYTGKNGTGDLYCYTDDDGNMLYRYTLQNDSSTSVGGKDANGADQTYVKGQTGYFTKDVINTDSGKGGGLQMKKTLYLYAKWAPLEYDVTLYSYDDGNEAAGDAGSAHLVGTLKNVRYGTLRVPNVNDVADEFVTETDNSSGKTYGVLDTTLNMVREHYDFIGWNLYDGQDWAMFKPNELYKTGLIQTTADGTSKALYAAWKIKDNYKITYNGNGGTSTTLTGNVFKGEDYTVTEDVPKYSGHSFVAWNTAPNGSGTKYVSGAEITGVTENITLYAQWEENKSVIYNTNGGTASTSLSVLKPAKGETVALDFDTEIIKSGYTFVGWDTNPYGKGGTKDSPAKKATYTEGGTSGFEMGDESVTLYAIWAPQQYNITYTAMDETQAARYTQTLQPDKYYHLETYRFDVRVDTSKWGTNEMKVSINNQSIGIPTPATEGDTAIYTFEIQGATGDQAIKIGGLTARSYNVSLDAKGGTIVADENVTYYVSGETKTLPGSDNVTRTGYTFDGWYKDGDATGTSVTAIGVDETGDKKFYAKWRANTYTVAYDANGGTGAPVDTGANATYDEDYTILGRGGMTYTADATVEFLGWSTNRDAVTPEYLAGATVKNLATGAGDDTMITLYAVWKVPTYTISYMLGGGTAGGNGSIPPQEVKASASATIADLEMKKTGYKFQHWAENSTTYSNGDTILNVVENHILNAVWEPGTYSILFINPGDTEDGNKSKLQSNIEYGESVALETNTFESTETEYTAFLGWATTTQAAVTTRTPQYLDGQKVMNLSETDGDVVELYAVWGSTPVKYLNYDANGGTYSGSTPEVQAASDGKAVVQFVTTPTKEGYTFQGWKTADGTHTYTEGMNETALTVNLDSGNVTLYADWKANTYTVTYKPNFTGDNVPDDKTQEIEYDTTDRLDENTFTREHYTFLGWSEDEDATAPTYQNQQSVLNLPVTEIADGDGAKGITLYAVWQAESPIYLTYNANGGTGAPASESIYAGESVTLSSVEPAREGYTFLGWATSSTAATAEYAEGAEITDGFSTSTTLYAVWEKKLAYAVSYDVNDGYGSVPVDSTGYYEGDIVTVRFNPIPMKSGYTFSGWNCGNDTYSYNAESANTATFEMGTDNVTLQAKWTPNTYTIIFKNDTETKRQENVKYVTATALTANSFNAPTGKKFAGWATNDGGSVKYADKAEVTGLTGVANGEVTLYAVWEPIAVTITFDQQEGTGGLESTPATYGQQLPSAAAPSREGYTFGGYWTAQNGGGTQYYGDYMNALKNVDFISDTTLYAKWTAKTYNVTYMYGTDILQTDALTYGNKTTVRNASVIGAKMPEGMKLSGWAKTDNGTVAYPAGQTDVDLWNGGNDVVLYAILKKDVKYTVTYVPGYGTTFPVDTTQYEDGDTVTVELEKNQPAQYGYTFLGWSDVPNATTATYREDLVTQFPIQDNTTLYGVWSVGTYKVTYDGNGGTESFGGVANANVLGNVEMLRYSFQHPKAIYTKTGYSLLGWAQSKDKADLGQIDFAKGQVINPDLTTKAGDEVTLYAVWQANKYTVTFNPNNTDATVSETEREVTYGEKYGSAFPTPTLSGRTFLGWFTQAEDGTQVKNTDKVEITGNQTLYAHWNTIQYQITTMDNGVGKVTLTKPGTATTPEEITGGKADAGTEITVTVAPRDNYTIDNVTLYVDGSPVSMEGTAESTYSFTLNKDTKIALKANGNTGAKYTVKYDGNVGDDNIGTIADSSFVVGQAATLSDGTGFSRTGYVLTGWNTRADGNGTPYGLGTEQTTALTQTAGGEVTLYAQWSATNCTVTFSAGEGAQLSETTKDVTFGKAYGTLPTPTKTDAVFAGWYLAEDCAEGTLVTSMTVVSNSAAHTLYARWETAEYIITTKANDLGTIALAKSGTTEVVTDKAAANTEITVTVTPRDNYTIDNVKLYVNGTPVVMTEGTGGSNGTYTFTLKQNTEIALEENSNIGIKYTVEYKGNGGTGEIQSVSAVSGKTFALASEGFTMSGSALSGWNTMQGGTGKAYTLGETVKDLTLEPGGTVTLYAQWSENNPAGYTYTIRYEANGGVGTAYEQQMQQNRLNVALYDGAGFSRTGYALVGWANTTGGTVDYQLGGKLSAPLASQEGAVKTLYAVWEKGAIRVTLNDEKGVNTVTSLVLNTGDTYGRLPNLSLTGWTFDGWFTEGGERVDNSTEVTAISDHTLYARWTEEAAKTYTVTVLADSTLGTITLNPSGGKYAAGTEVIATATPETDKTIKVISSSGEIYWREVDNDYTGALAVTQDITLILVDATQVTDNTWYLFYNANGGSGSMDVEIVNNTEAKAKASTFSRDGYEFAGWKDGSGTAYEVDGTVTKPINSKVLTLYAQWQATEENTYTVKFDAQGGDLTEEATRTYHAGDTYGALPTPVKSGDWSFGGWYSDSAFATRVYDTTTVQSRNHTLYAKWVSRTAVAVTAVGYDGEYDGVAHALTATSSKTLTGATYQWFKDGNAVQGAAGKTLYVKNVADSGNYTCVVSGSYNGVGYTGMESTTAVVNITKKALTITAADAAVVYGADAPAYALSYSGFAAADNAGVLEGEATIHCAYAKGDNAGSYPINVEAGNLVAANYDVNVVRGTLTVKPLPVALEWSGTKLEHTGEAQFITATVKNAVGEDTFILAYDGNTATAVNTPDGSYYTATVTGLGNDNYTLTGATGKVHNWVIYAQGTDPGTVPDPVQPDEETTEVVTGITLDPTTKTLEEGETCTLTYTLQPDGATDTVSFSSSDAGIASVDEYGNVKAVKAGTAVITATTKGGLTASCTVNVNAKASEDSIPVTGLTVQYASYKMTKSGQTFNIGAKVTPSNAANQGITYSSSNNAVATVDSTGKVTAISGGSAVIYAQTVDGGYTMICNVTVEIKNSSSGGSSGGGGSSSGGSSGGSSSGSSSGSKTDGKTDDQTNNGTTGGNTKGGSISAGGTGNTAYSGCEHKSDCPIHPFMDAYTDAWYHNGVHYCIDNDLMGGYGDDLFGPNDKITRAQIAMILWHIAGSPTVNHAMSFKDVPEGEWYTEAVRWATDIGVASGYSDDQFAPNDSITREQFAAMLYRFAQLQGKDTSRGSTNTLRGFADVSKISAYALAAMQWANGTEIISGVDTSTLDPQGYATRAQAACMIQRYILNLAE